MKIGIAEIFKSIQGEGSQAGKPALFIRLSNCNLWNGRLEDRNKGKGNCSQWCDTDFIKKYKLTNDELLDSILEYCKGKRKALIVFTGGEPLLQAKKLIKLVTMLLNKKIYVSIETNGTIANQLVDILVDHEYGHVVLSPKKINDSFNCIKLTRCNDLKIVVPDNIDFNFDSVSYDNLYFEPKDEGDQGVKNIERCIFYASRFGAKVSIQQHKLVGLR